MEQLEVVIKNNTRLTFYRYVQTLEKAEWVYHPAERIGPGVMASFVCSNSAYQSILGCRVLYSVIIDGTEYFFSYRYESHLIGDFEAKVGTGVVECDHSFREGGNDFKEIFYLDSTNGLQRSCKRLMTHINVRETEFGNALLNELDSKNGNDESERNNPELNKNLNSSYYEWIRRLRTFPRSLYIRVVNLSDYSLTLQLPAAKKGDKEKFKNRNLGNSTISSAVTPSMHIESHNENLVTRGPNSPYSMANLVFGGLWVEFPPEVIHGNSVVEFGASCESLFSADFRGSLVYRISGYAGKVLLGWDFPAGFTPYLTCKSFHDLHNLTITSHYENFNYGSLVFHIIDESKPPILRLLSMKAIFSDRFLSIVSEHPAGEEKRSSSENPLDYLFGKGNKDTLKINSRFGNGFSSKAPIKSNEELDSKRNLSRDILPFFLEYKKPKAIIPDGDGLAFLYEFINIDSPRVLLSSLLAGCNVNLQPKYSGNIDSISLLIEWSVGCEIFARVWGADEKPILLSSCVGGINDYRSILNAFYPTACRRSKSRERIYRYYGEKGGGTGCGEEFSLCQMGCFFREENDSSPEMVRKPQYSHLEISLIGQQLLAQVLAPYLVKYLKSSTLAKGGTSSNISNSSRFSNTSSVLQGFVGQDHIWKYSNIKIAKGASSFEEKDSRQGILDFQGTISFLIFHWDDVFYDLFEKKLARLSLFNQPEFNPDSLLCIIQRVSLLWENKDFEFFDDPCFVREFIDAAITICRMIENDEQSQVLNNFLKLRDSIRMEPGD
ncbi:hypothetical protein HWI79_3406 [Cryptosporidium felis]|nr:hypothetical protein HWI79_3406 [Cryptosporidium felis]